MNRILGAGLLLAATVAVAARAAATPQPSPPYLAWTTTMKSLEYQMNHYQPTAAWAAQLKIDQAAEAAAYAKLEAALNPPNPKASSNTKLFRGPNGIEYTVTLKGIRDPAQQAPGEQPPATGDRYVAVTFEVTNASKSGVTGDDDADNFATLVGSNGQQYQSTVAQMATGKYLGRFDLIPGESDTGYTVFELPTGVKVADVVWNPQNGSGGYGEWQVAQS